MSLKPAIAYSEMTERWYFVTAWKKEGQAKAKFDITEQMEEIIAGVADQATQPYVELLKEMTDKVEQLTAHLGYQGGEPRDLEVDALVKRAREGLKDGRV